VILGDCGGKVKEWSDKEIKSSIIAHRHKKEEDNTLCLSYHCHSYKIKMCAFAIKYVTSRFLMCPCQ